MAMALNIIGTVLGGITMIPFLQTLFPAEQEHITTVRIGVGLSLNSVDDTKGNTPGIRLFDVVGRPIGEKRGSKALIADGGIADIEVPSDLDIGDRQAQYVSISKGGNDALCIAYVTVTWPGGQGNRAWYGDVGFECGADWYHSQTIAGDDDYTPKCTWIDGDASNGITVQGMGIHITDFTATTERADAYAADNDLMCKSKPRFHLYEKLTSDYYLPYFDPPLKYEAGTLLDLDKSKVMVQGSSRGKLPPERRRSLFERHSFNHTSTPFMGNRLITSRNKAHSAVELCTSQSSKGADFVSLHEGLFCDMSEKEIWQVCDHGNQTACFDTTNGNMRPGLGLFGRDTSSGRAVPSKSYTKTDHW